MEIEQEIREKVYALHKGAVGVAMSVCDLTDFGKTDAIIRTIDELEQKLDVIISLSNKIKAEFPNARLRATAKRL